MKRLIFDTSVINALAEDADGTAITHSLGLAYHVGITETLLEEVAAYDDNEGRAALLDNLKRLLSNGICMMPYHWIIQEQAKAYQRNSAAYDWRALSVCSLEAETEIARQEFINTISAESKASNRAADKQYRGIFAAAREAFQNLFVGDTDVRPSFREVTENLLGDGGAHLTIGADLFERATGTRPTEPEIKDFIGRCPPFKALLVALCFSQYDRCVRKEGEPSLGRAGRLDMFSAVYLPYCKIFMTNDEGQYKALTEVSNLLGLGVSIMMYGDFKRDLIGLAG